MPPDPVEERARKVIHSTLAAAYGEGGASYFEEADLILDALASAGLQVTDLTEEKPQRQDSLGDQLRDLRKIATREGMYDAADWIRMRTLAGGK